MAVQISHRLAVDLHDMEIQPLMLHQIFGQNTHARADLKGTLDIRRQGLHYPLRDTLIGQKMLTEKLLCSDFSHLVLRAL